MTSTLDQVLDGVERVTAEAQSLLEAGRDRAEDARHATASRLYNARSRLRDFGDDAAHRTRRTARHVDRYAHEHPWQLAGIGIALATAAVLAAWLLIDSARE
jgi:ElaB/YqjD/DUF883 family membrane-anchored ribosome-binding protein